MNQEGGPFTYRPQNLPHDNIREINAKTHVMNELIDEACGRVLDHLAAKGWLTDTDVFFTDSLPAEFNRLDVEAVA